MKVCKLLLSVVLLCLGFESGLFGRGPGTFGDFTQPKNGDYRDTGLSLPEFGKGVVSFTVNPDARCIWVHLAHPGNGGTPFKGGSTY